MPPYAPLWGRAEGNGTFADLGPRVAEAAVAGRPAHGRGRAERGRLSMRGNRLVSNLTGIAAAVAVAGLLAGLAAAGSRPAAAATRTTQPAAAATRTTGAVAAAGV